MISGHELFVIVLMLGLNAVFAGFEMALASISHARLLVLVNQRRAGASSALVLKERLGASLAAAQIGVTLAAAIAAAMGGASVQETVAPRLAAILGLTPTVARLLAVLLFVIPLGAFTIVFGELIPKIFAIENKEWVCLRLAPFMRAFTWLVWPAAKLFEGIVKVILRFTHWVFKSRKEEWGDIPGFHELQAAASLARTKRLMGAREEKIVLSAAQLSRRKIQEILLPASEISMIPSQLSLGEALIRAHLDLHTRFPICAEENNPQSIEGYITFKDLVSALKMHATTPTVKGIARPIRKIAPELAISHVLEQMMKEKLHIALVAAPDGRVQGLVTLEDIIEELVGDIEDEADSLSGHMHPTSGGWLMGGGVPMYAVGSRLGLPWSPSFTNETPVRLADWCERILKRPLKKGETVRAEGLQVVARKLRRRRLAEAFVSKYVEPSRSAAG